MNATIITAHCALCIYAVMISEWMQTNVRSNGKKVLLPRWSSFTHSHVFCAKQHVGKTSVRCSLIARINGRKKSHRLIQSLHQGAMVWEKREMIRCIYVLFDTHRQSIWKKMLQTSNQNETSGVCYMFLIVYLHFRVKRSVQRLLFSYSCLVLLIAKKKKATKKKCVCRQFFARVRCTKVQDAADTQAHTQTHTHQTQWRMTRYTNERKKWQIGMNSASESAYCFFHEKNEQLID